MGILWIARVEVVGGGIRSQMGQVGGAGGGAEVAGGVAGFWRSPVSFKFGRLAELVLKGYKCSFMDGPWGTTLRDLAA
nr:hypothetical protein [Tanacetum cinerariifolium]